MAKTVGQVRFYGDGDRRNYPQGLTISQLQSGVCFNDYYPIVQLGVQTLPGAKMYLNKDSEPIIIGVTGIYELNIDGLSYINSIGFDRKHLELIKNNDSGNTTRYLIVDFITERGE